MQFLDLRAPCKRQHGGGIKLREFGGVYDKGYN